jgi:hypothetical protein
VTRIVSRTLLLGLSIFGAFVIGLILWFGYVNSDPQGGANLSCTKVDFDPVRSATGWVASGHNTVCDGFGGDSAIYIYVHRANEKENSDRLVLRYSERTDWDLPKIEWTGATELTIRVNHAIQVTKRVTSKGVVRIKYEIEREDYPGVNVQK